MPLQNRVTPLGDLVADTARGLVYGNRGCLHDDAGRIVRRYQVKRWIACRLRFEDRRRSPLMRPGRFTELFFLDEATALAAGHRPCAECRRDDYMRFRERWAQRHPFDRTADDVESLLPLDPSVRLVKGAYREPAELLVGGRGLIEESYRVLALRLVEGRGPVGRVVLGTHDVDLAAGRLPGQSFNSRCQRWDVVVDAATDGFEVMRLDEETFVGARGGGRAQKREHGEKALHGIASARTTASCMKSIFLR